MGIEITYKTTCDFCGKVKVRKLKLTPETIEKESGCFDIWSPAWPEGWIQVRGKCPKFKCPKCYELELAEIRKKNPKYQDIWIA